MRWLAAPLGWALALGLSTAQAATAPALSLEQQARRADVIVRGSLGAPQAVTEGNVSWRVYPLTLTETVAGDAGQLAQHAGQPALYIWSEATDLPQWRTGQDAFFLLYAAKMDSPLVGYNQGYYPVSDDAVTVPGRQNAASQASASQASASQTSASQPPVSQTGQAAELGQTATSLLPQPQLSESQRPVAAEVQAQLDGVDDGSAPLDPAPEAPVPGLPSGSESTGTAPEAGALLTPPQTAAPSAAERLSVAEFRALLLRARASSPARLQGGGQ